MKDVNILIENGANVKKALELFGDMETYDQTLEVFLNEVPQKLQKIKSCKEIGDMTNYAILVHSLKSDARYFGFEELGEIAYKHELESKANNLYYVTEHYDELINEEQVSAKITKAAVDKIGEVGTGSGSSNYELKGGDTVYVTSDRLSVMVDADENSQKIATLV